MKPAIALAALFISACAGSPDLKITDPTDTTAVADSCAAARPSFGAPATAADRALFAYDTKAPLNLQMKVDSIANGVEFNSITFDSPAGGSVPGLMNRPIARSGPRPGVVVMHPSGNATAPVKGARLAQNEMAALARRGIERRLEAAVIMAGYGGSVTLATHKDRVQGLSTLSCAVRTAWFRDNVPIEPIRFIPGAAPTALLFQIARFDVAVPLEDAQAVYDAASSPKEVLYYDTGHGLNQQATVDRFTWLAKQIGIDP